MTDESSTRLSKFLSYILRHHPEAIGLELDSHGWAHIPSLIQKARKHDRTISREQIMEVIQESGRQRFLLSPDGQYIRAAYGHSIVVDLSLEPKQPPEVLYHGTARKNIDSILEEGLHSAGRNFVHLSVNKEDAVSNRPTPWTTGGSWYSRLYHAPGRLSLLSVRKRARHLDGQ